MTYTASVYAVEGTVILYEDQRRKVELLRRETLNAKDVGKGGNHRHIGAYNSGKRENRVSRHYCA